MNSLFDDLTVGGQTLRTEVKLDDVLRQITQANDYAFTGESCFTVPSFIKPSDYKLGVIVGESGTGKSTLLQHFGTPVPFEADPSLAVASQIDVNLLMTLGLASIPSLCRPYHVLSNGEKHRVELAYTLAQKAPVFDEFTSTVHRTLARTICIALRKYIDRNECSLVLATCHDDVVEWLEPDWVFSTKTQHITKRRLERRRIHFEINPCHAKAWKFFKDFHYLTADINRSARCWVLHCENKLAGFYSSIPLPSGTLKNAYRGHRLVILPDFQGLGLSSLLTEYVAELHIKNGCRFYGKTAHPKLGQHRENSTKWRATTKNLLDRSKDYLKQPEYRKNDDSSLRTRLVDWQKHARRICYSHEYTG